MEIWYAIVKASLHKALTGHTIEEILFKDGVIELLKCKDCEKIFYQGRE